MGYAEQCKAAEDEGFRSSFFQKIARLQTLGFSVRIDFLDFGGTIIEITKDSKNLYCESSSSLEYLIHKTQSNLKELINE